MRSESSLCDNPCIRRLCFMTSPNGGSSYVNPFHLNISLHFALLMWNPYPLLYMVKRISHIYTWKGRRNDFIS